MASQPRFIGGRKWLIGVPLGPFGYFRSPDSGPIPIFQTVSRDCFAKGDRRVSGPLGGYDQGVRYPRPRRPSCRVPIVLIPPTSPTRSGLCWSPSWPPPKGEVVHRNGLPSASRTPFSTY